MDAHPISLLGPSLGTVACCLAYSRSITAVSSARRKHKVSPPSVEGPEEFQCALRAQQNTLEFLVMVLPLIWSAALLIPFWGSLFGGSLGLAWALFRVSYISGYVRSPSERLFGFYGSLNVLKTLLGLNVVGMLYQIARLLGKMQ